VLRIAPRERVVIVADDGSAAMGLALHEAAEVSGAWSKLVNLDTMESTAGHGRPHRVLPARLREALSDAHASAFVAAAFPQELNARQEILHLVRDHFLRHAHMPSISETAFVAGLQQDYRELREAAEAVLRRAERGTVLTCTSPGGTRLEVRLPADARWFPQLGVLVPGQWGNLPAGALYCSSDAISGVFVADASLGEFFGAREGLLEGRPVRFTIESGRVVSVEAEGRDALLRDVRAMLALGPESSRVGLVALGVNGGIGRATGEALVDQNLPGLHLGIGDPAAQATGAGWRAATSFAACQVGATVEVDGEAVIRDGVVVATV
jgi:leucyl aminopeptidase (aminopeptidase T)